MSRFLGTVLASACVLAFTGSVRADDKDVTAILDKAIKALGGEEKLSKVKATMMKTKGKLSIMGTDAEFTTEMTTQGLDHQLSLFQGDFGGMTIKAVTVLAGDKGWRGFNDMNMSLEKDDLANTKRMQYLSLIPTTILPLKDKAFKIAGSSEEKVGGKAAVTLKVTGPDGKDFTISFDKESGLPVRVVGKVLGFMGDEYTQETLLSEYKEMGGIQKATKIVNNRDGEKMMESTITEFKVLDKVDPKTFAEPK